VPWASCGCVGVLQFRPERASGVWLLKSKFSLSALRKSSAARLLQRHRNRPPPSPNRRHRAKGGSWVSWGSWGCVGVLQFRPERASGVWLLESKFSLSALRKSSAAHLLQRYRNRISGSQTAPPSPNRGHLAKEGPWVPWGSWGCVGVLRFRPERASGVWLRKSNFRYLH